MYSVLTKLSTTIVEKLKLLVNDGHGRVSTNMYVKLNLVIVHGNSMLQH